MELRYLTGGAGSGNRRFSLTSNLDTQFQCPSYHGSTSNFLRDPPFLGMLLKLLPSPGKFLPKNWKQSSLLVTADGLFAYYNTAS